jgi:hypothetical protein
MYSLHAAGEKPQIFYFVRSRSVAESRACANYHLKTKYRGLHVLLSRCMSTFKTEIVPKRPPCVIVHMMTPVTD